ncbi:MAG: hypothetical protein WAO11_07455, partial [Candidatus Acidiferrum sp.]
MSAKKLTKNSRHPVAAIFLSILALSFWAADRVWPRHLPSTFERRMPRPKISDRRLVLPFSNGVACAEIASFDDQLEAFLRFE